jgi:hypothetical protein
MLSVVVIVVEVEIVVEVVEVVVVLVGDLVVVVGLVSLHGNWLVSGSSSTLTVGRA